jgi:hypothetical protein
VPLPDTTAANTKLASPATINISVFNIRGVPSNPFFKTKVHALAASYST